MSVGIRHDDLRRRNRAMVISAVRRASQPSRTEIAAVTGLSHSTISTISSDLIAEGILAEAKGGEQAPMKRGRPQVGLALEADAASVVAVVLSLNHLSASVIDYAGNQIVEETRRLVTQRLPAKALVDECVAIVRQVIELSGRPQASVLRIALAIQGTTDAGARKLLWSPITPHDDIQFADRLEREFGVTVTVENDCNMIAEALHWRDPARYRDDFIAILLSHGIGMGLVIKGELFTGTQSSGAEFGHMVHRPDGALCRCGRRGCIEAYAGNYAIWRNARLGDENAEPLADLSDEDIKALADAARDHDGPEREAFRKAGEAIGFGLGSMFALFDPAPLAFVGVGATAFDIMEPHVRSAIAKTAGGTHSKAISFDTEPNEVPLIREGCTMRALLYVDEEVFAVGSVPSRAGADIPLKDI